LLKLFGDLYWGGQIDRPLLEHLWQIASELGEVSIGRSLNRQDPMAFCEQLLCNGQAKAAGCAGDDGDG
jgi:hypothetical protein